MESIIVPRVHFVFQRAMPKPRCKVPADLCFPDIGNVLRVPAPNGPQRPRNRLGPPSLAPVAAHRTPVNSVN